MTSSTIVERQVEAAAARRKRDALATGMTPTGVVVCAAPPLSDEWFEARREGITATDMAKILGLSDHGNAVSVWMDKRGEWDDEAGEAAEWGHELEPVVARVWCRRNGTHAAPIEMLGKRGALWMRASLDRLVSECPHGLTDKRYSCGLEIKTRSAWVAGNWRDDMPDDVLAQVAHQRTVTGLHHIHVACLIGGQRLVEHLYTADAQLEAFIVAEAERVWRHVGDGTQPTAAPNALLTRVLNRRFPNREGVVDVPADEALAAIGRYEEARLDEKAAKLRRESAKAEMVLALGDNEAAFVDDRLAYSYQANTAGTRSISITQAFRKQGPA